MLVLTLVLVLVLTLLEQIRCCVAYCADCATLQ